MKFFKKFSEQFEEAKANVKLLNEQQKMFSFRMIWFGDLLPKPLMNRLPGGKSPGVIYSEIFECLTKFKKDFSERIIEQQNAKVLKKWLDFAYQASNPFKKISVEEKKNNLAMMQKIEKLFENTEAGWFYVEDETFLLELENDLKKSEQIEKQKVWEQCGLKGKCA